MATFLGRRYMRDKVPFTETVIGGAVLALTAVIVCAVVLISRQPSDPLFQVKPGNEKHPLDRGWVVARSMMAGLGTAGWTSATDIEVVRPLEEKDSPPDGELAAFDVECVYRGRYVSRNDPAQSVHVMICDARQPRNAFGLFKSQTPPDAEPLNAGCEGWQRDNTAAFWAGRYYTRFEREHVGGDEPSIKTIADALAGIQLRYGAPFWAESVLPADGRQPGSFRFTHVQAAGFDFLYDAFLADYDRGVTAFVTDLASPAKADGLLRQFEQYLENQGRIQAAPGPNSSLLAGDSTGRQLAVFVSGPRLFGAVGPDMQPVSALVKAMQATVAPLASETAAPSAVVERSPLPELTLRGWGSPTDVRTFTPENLWEKIDGRADLYLSFHVVKMTFGTYRNAREPESFVDVYLYDMGEPDNAFGIYRAEMSQHPEPADLGRGGYATPGGVFFWKGSHYVRVEAADASEALAETATSVAQTLAREIEDDGRPLWADALLPAADRVEGTFEYQARDAFSLDFLHDTFSADYRAAGKTFKTFIYRGENDEDARAVFDAYAKFFEEFGSVLKRGTGAGYDFVVGDSGGVVDAVFVASKYVGGISNLNDAASAEQRMAAFAESLTTKPE